MIERSRVRLGLRQIGEQVDDRNGSRALEEFAVAWTKRISQLQASKKKDEIIINNYL